MSVVLIKAFYFRVINIFAEPLNKKLWEKSFFVIKPKQTFFGESQTDFF